MKKIASALLLLPFLCMIFSCDSRGVRISGTWEDNERVIVFAENTFTLTRKNSNQLKAFRGTYTFASNPEYAMYLSYTEFQDSDGIWSTLVGTEFEGYRETALFSASENQLTLKILESGVTYRLFRKN